MIERLRSHLKRTRGFTLVELLIVIAIIAILVLLVIVAINPLERIRDANDRRAQNEARQGGSAVAACITKELAKGASPFSTTSSLCDTKPELQANGYISNEASMANSTIAVNDSDDACITTTNVGGHGDVSVWWTFNGATMTDPEVTTTEPVAFCP